MTHPSLRPMDAFDPTEPAILHDRVSDTIITWTADQAVFDRGGAGFIGDEFSPFAFQLHNRVLPNSAGTAGRREMHDYNPRLNEFDRFKLRQ